MIHICHQSHIFLNEVGGLSALAGAHPRILKNNPDGTLPLDELEKAIRHDDLHYPPTRLITLENTHNYCMGSPLTPDYMERVGQIAKDHSLAIHLDGARVFNAAVALKRISDVFRSILRPFRTYREKIDKNVRFES